MQPVYKKKKEVKREVTSTNLLAGEVSVGFFTWFKQI